MKHDKGFTIVEILVVIIIIGILGTLAGVQVGRSQLVARDKERENDVKIIASVLERIYETGQVDGAVIPSENVAVTSSVPLNYPSRLFPESTSTPAKAILGAMDTNALKSPLKKSYSLVSASSATGVIGTTAGGRTIAANTTDDVYVYQPLRELSANSYEFCTKASAIATPGYAYDIISPRSAEPGYCSNFNIYYFSESSNSIKTLSSKGIGRNSL